MRYLDGDEELWADMLEMFQVELDRIVVAVIDAADSGEMQAAQVALHDLKGLAPTVGAAELLQVALTLEATLRADRPLARGHAETFNGACERFVVAAKSLLSDRGRAF